MPDFTWPATIADLETTREQLEVLRLHVRECEERIEELERRRRVLERLVDSVQQYALLLTDQPVDSLVCQRCQGHGHYPARDETAVGTAVRMHTCPACLGSGQVVGTHSRTSPSEGQP